MLKKENQRLKDEMDEQELLAASRESQLRLKVHNRMA